MVRIKKEEPVKRKKTKKEKKAEKRRKKREEIIRETIDFMINGESPPYLYDDHKK